MLTQGLNDPRGQSTGRPARPPTCATPLDLSAPNRAMTPGRADNFVERVWDDGGMGARVSDRLAAIAESATLAVDAKAKALKAAGRPVIGFGAGEPDFST